MKRTYYLIITILSFMALSFACEKEKDIELSDSDYLIFGHFYGMCQGERCIEIFKLEKAKLFKDLRKKYPSSQDFYVGEYVELSQEKFEAAKDLVDYFPKDLLKEKERRIGEPDASDGGGLYIEYCIGGIRKFWILDKMKMRVPNKYHVFIDEVNEKIKRLR